MPATWWLTKQSYFLFMLRELSSVFVALFLVVYLCQLYQLSQGPDAYSRLHAKAQFARLDSFPLGGAAVRAVPQLYLVSVERRGPAAAHRRAFDFPLDRYGAARRRLGDRLSRCSSSIPRA